eukprot:2934643-Rhodomonas_salina.1
MEARRRPAGSARSPSATTARTRRACSQPLISRQTDVDIDAHAHAHAEADTEADTDTDTIRLYPGCNCTTASV